MAPNLAGLIALLKTLGYDLTTFQTLQRDVRRYEAVNFRDELNVYGGALTEDEANLPPDQIPQRRFIAELSQIMTNLAHEGIAPLQNLFERHAPLMNRTLEAHLQDRSSATHLGSTTGDTLWTLGIGAFLAQQIYVCVEGPDAAYAPALAPTIMRSFPYFWNKLTGPTRNPRLRYSGVEQRIVSALPGLVLYTTVSKQGVQKFYGTVPYDILLAFLSVGSVTYISVKKRYDRYLTRRDIRRIAALRQGDVELPAGAQGRLRGSATHLRGWIARVQIVRDRRNIGRSTGEEFAFMATEASIYAEATEALLEERLANGAQLSPDADQIIALIVVAGCIGALALGSTARNPQNVFTVLGWIWYLIDRMIDDLTNPVKRAKDAASTLSEAGTTVIFTFFTVYLLLLIYGENAFDDKTRFWVSLALQLYLNATVAHEVGPTFAKLILPLVQRLSAFGARVRNRVRRHQREQPTTMTALPASGRVTEIPDLQVPPRAITASDNSLTIEEILGNTDAPPIPRERIPVLASLNMGDLGFTPAESSSAGAIREALLQPRQDTADGLAAFKDLIAEFEKEWEQPLTGLEARVETLEKNSDEDDDRLASLERAFEAAGVSLDDGEDEADDNEERDQREQDRTRTFLEALIEQPGPLEAITEAVTESKMTE